VPKRRNRGLNGEFLWMGRGGKKQGRTRMALIPHAVEEGEVRAAFISVSSVLRMIAKCGGECGFLWLFSANR